MALAYNQVQGTLVRSPPLVLLSHPSCPDGCGVCCPLDCRFPSMLSRGAECICWVVFLYLHVCVCVFLYLCLCVPCCVAG